MVYKMKLASTLHGISMKKRIMLCRADTENNSFVIFNIDNFTLIIIHLIIAFGVAKSNNRLLFPAS